jgi:hypothetical protein
MVREMKANIVINFNNRVLMLMKLIISQISTLKSHMQTPKRVSVIFIWLMKNLILVVEN